MEAFLNMLVICVTLQEVKRHCACSCTSYNNSSSSNNKQITIRAMVSVYCSFHVGYCLLSFRPLHYTFLFISHGKWWLDGNFNFVNEHTTSYPVGNHDTASRCWSSIFGCLYGVPSFPPPVCLWWYFCPHWRWEQVVFIPRDYWRGHLHHYYIDLWKK